MFLVVYEKSSTVDRERLCGKKFKRLGAAWEKNDERKSLKKLADASGCRIEEI